MMGLVLASIVLTIAHGSWLVGEAVAARCISSAARCFRSSAAGLAAAGRLRDAGDLLARARAAGARRACGAAVSVAGRLSATAELLVLLVAMTAALGVIAAATFRRCDHIARERGLIDRTTNY